MKRNHFTHNQDNGSAPEDHGFLGELIAKYFKRKLESAESQANEASDFESDKVYHKVLHTIHRQQRRTIIIRQRLAIAAAITVLIGVGSVMYYHNVHAPKTLAAIALQEKKAARGQRVFIALADGTKVWLNADSKLSYPDDFKGDKREVTLSGEAYFEVVHRDKQPFIIHTGEVRTVVLGTSFNIKAYPENPRVEVTVVSGKVAVITPDEKGGKEHTAYLAPAQKAIYNSASKELQPVGQIDVATSIGWKEGKLIYRSTEIKQVITEVERKYNTTIRYNDKISRCKITADFNDDELSTVLKVMAKLIDGTVVYRNGNYYLDGSGCE